MQRDIHEILQSQRKMLESLGEPTDRYTEAELTQRLSGPYRNDSGLAEPAREYGCANRPLS